MSRKIKAKERKRRNTVAKRRERHNARRKGKTYKQEKFTQQENTILGFLAAQYFMKKRTKEDELWEKLRDQTS